MCKWFDDVFLRSLFDQTGTNRDKWITAKQTAICIKYMQRSTANIETASGTYKHDNYYYQWEGRQIFLSYSKLNGCSTINFSLTPEEIEEANTAYKAEKLQQMKDRAKSRYTRHPERHLDYIRKLEDKINSYQEEIKESIKENDTDGIENLYKFVEELETELKIQREVMTL